MSEVKNKNVETETAPVEAPAEKRKQVAASFNSAELTTIQTERFAGQYERISDYVRAAVLEKAERDKAARAAK